MEMPTSDERCDQAASMRALSDRLTEMASDARAGGHGRVDLTPSAVDVLAAYLGRWAELIDPPRKGRKPCAHGDVCRAYMREHGVILRDTCPRCEHYEPMRG